MVYLPYSHFGYIGRSFRVHEKLKQPTSLPPLLLLVGKLFRTTSSNYEYAKIDFYTGYFPYLVFRAIFVDLVIKHYFISSLRVGNLDTAPSWIMRLLRCKI